MSRDTVAVWIALAATLLAVGWHLHFHSLSAYVSFWLLAGLTGVASWRLARSLFPRIGRGDAIIRATIIAFSAIVITGWTLGSVGLITLPLYLCLAAAAFVMSVAFAPPLPQPANAPRTRVPPAIAVVALPLLAFIVAVGLVQSPLTLYDSVSYHLLFSARWLQEHRLSIVPTPFSDPAQAYQPANGELFFLWLMLPFHGDLLARIGQLPFLALAGGSLYAMARRCGARPEHAAYAPLFLLLTRPVVEQAAGADVDLICAATFVASLYLGIVAVDRDLRRDWALWGVSVGLFLGSKYLAVVYVAVLLLVALVRGPRLKALWGLPGIVLFGLPWYARNWIVTGSPIYPASLPVVGRFIAPGAFTRDAMNNSVFHVTDLRLLPVIAAHAFGAATALVWLPLTCVGLAAFARRRRWWPGVYVAAVPLAMGALFWFGIPDNADSRFLLPAVAVAMLPLTFTFGANRRVNAGLHAACLVGAAWILVGTPRQIPLSLPWFMGDWLAFDGLVSRRALPIFAGAVVAAAAVRYALARRPAHAAAWLAGVCGLACWVLTISAQASYTSDGSSLLALSPTYIRAGMIGAWDWVHRNLAHATLANTGNNLPYPLFDEHLSNRVYYVNIDRHRNWRFHEYARGRSRAAAGATGDLADPSGQLEPLGERRPPSEASRPRYDRWEGQPEAWIQNLRATGVTHLFVSVLSAYEIGYVRHNEGGFPVEDDWARADPRTFTLLYENGQVRIYAMARP